MTATAYDDAREYIIGSREHTIENIVKGNILSLLSENGFDLTSGAKQIVKDAIIEALDGVSFTQPERYFGTVQFVFECYDDNGIPRRFPTLEKLLEAFPETYLPNGMPREIWAIHGETGVWVCGSDYVTSIPLTEGFRFKWNDVDDVEAFYNDAYHNGQSTEKYPERTLTWHDLQDLRKKYAKSGTNKSAD